MQVRETNLGSKAKRNSMTIREQDEGYDKATNGMESTDLERKALLFYKLAVVKDRRYRFRTYRSTFVGKEMVDSMVVSGLAESREQAVQLGRAMAERFDLFKSCDRTTCFEDEANTFYRFSSGALVLIGKMNEMELSEDGNSLPTIVSSSVSTTSSEDRPSRGPGLQRQKGTRMIESCSNEFENDSFDDEVGSGKKRIVMSRKEINIFVPHSPAQANIEGDNKSRSSCVPSNINTTNIINNDMWSVGFSRELTEEPPEQESGEELEKTNAIHQRLISQRQTPMSSNITRAQGIEEKKDTRDGIVIQANRREQLLVAALPMLQRSRSVDRGDAYKPCQVKFDTNVSDLLVQKCKTWDEGDRLEKKSREDHHISLIDEFDTETLEDLYSMERETSPITNKEGECKEPSKTQNTTKSIPSSKVQLAEQADAEPGIQSLLQHEPDEQRSHIFVTSPRDLPCGIRRRMSKKTECFENFEFILNENEGNLLSNCNDDDQSIWTECIIGDEEGRKKYRQNKTRRDLSSYSSRVNIPAIDETEKTVTNIGTVYEDTVYDEDVMKSKLNSKMSKAMDWAAKQDVDDQSHMDYSIVDESVAVSYVEDDEEQTTPESSPERKAAKDLSYLFANHDAMSSDLFANHDVMTSRLCGNHDVMTSKLRVQTILRNDLSSDNCRVVELAMEELRRIVASEPNNRKQIVRMGGVMAIMGTMEKHSKQEVIQYYCCVIIELLASMETDAMKAFNEMKGIQLVVLSMQIQSDSDRIQEAGRAALATLCRMPQPGMLYY